MHGLSYKFVENTFLEGYDLGVFYNSKDKKRKSQRLCQMIKPYQKQDNITYLLDSRKKRLDRDNIIQDIQRAKAIVSVIGVGRPAYFTCPIKRLLIYASPKYCYEDNLKQDHFCNTNFEHNENTINDWFLKFYGGRGKVFVDKQFDYVAYDFSNFYLKNALKDFQYVPLLYLEYKTEELSQIEYKLK